MNILGYNAAYTRPDIDDNQGRHALNDGSAAWLTDSRLLFAAIEERYCGTRYKGGINTLMERALKVYPDLPLPDVVAFSSCCGPIWSNDDARKQVAVDVFNNNAKWCDDFSRVKVLVVDHHKSHAMSAFVSSGFDRAMVVVYDGVGNLLNTDGWRSNCWWRGNFVRHSYFIAEWQDDQVSLTLLSREADGPDDVSLGEAYRALTHYGGWTSYQQAGSAMALAAFADPNCKMGLSIIRCYSDGIRVAMRNRRSEPIIMIKDLLQTKGIECVVPTGHTATPNDGAYCNLVSTLQSQLEDAIVQRVTKLAEQHRIEKIAMAGGVSLNCLAMGKLAEAFNGKVYVPPAPADTGQGIGNAFWAAYCKESPVSGKISRCLSLPDPPFWGVEIPETEIHLAALRARENSNIIVNETTPQRQAIIAAQALANGKVIATALGRSEFGPRALGARSVLADPRIPDIPDRVNQFKKREQFRPFAPAVLAENVTEYFCSKADSWFMSFAAPVQEVMKDRIPAVVHADGTARFQKVKNGPMYAILKEFYKLTGVPVLLNTSFNRNGQPIIETPLEAFDTFENSSLDMLLLDKLIITRKEYRL